VRFSESTITPKTYPECFEGIIHSFADRYQFSRKVYDQVIGLWNEHKIALKLPTERVGVMTLNEPCMLNVKKNMYIPDILKTEEVS